MNYKDSDKQYIANTYNRFDKVLVAGSSSIAKDENGNQFVDFGSGIGVNSLGYCDEDWSEAVCEQAHTLQHTSNLYYTKPAVDVAKKLCENSFASKVFFSNSGAEAVETSIKLARKYSFDKYGEGRHTIITLKNSFHGRTMTALSATGQDVFHNFFFPFDTSFKYAVAGDIDSVNNLIDSSVCAIMIELVQGEGGVIKLGKEFVESIYKLCQAKDILLIIDEVQTGIGRTGKLLASEYYDIVPDITAIAKGLGGGLPIGACLIGDKLANTFGYSHHGTTFGGNPVVCAGAMVVLNKLIDNCVIDSVCGKADYIKMRLTSCKEVLKVDGLGLMMGINLATKVASDVAKECLASGLLVLTAKDKIRLLPPLAITIDELRLGMDILVKVLEN